MIQFKSAGNVISVVLNTGIAVQGKENKTWTVTPTFQDADELSATLLIRHLRKRFHDKIEEVRRESYAEGYKDGRGKKRKEQFFSPYLP